jgi:hypothetical protein
MHRVKYTNTVRDQTKHIALKKVDEKFYLMGYNAMYFGGNLRSFGITYRLHLQGRRICCRQCSSDSLVDFHRTRRRYIPEDINLHSHQCENLKSNIYQILFQGIQRFHKQSRDHHCIRKVFHTENVGKLVLAALGKFFRTLFLGEGVSYYANRLSYTTPL